MILPPPISTLFPYTTLFRSKLWYNAENRRVGRFLGRGRNDQGYGTGQEPGAPPAHSRRGGAGLHAQGLPGRRDRKSTRLNSSHVEISYAGFCLKKKNIR